ncbi:MAG: BON domain-containing protein [Candidatus Hydrogenedentes bacterium]|nr:BON domain-containing protein [Candidatus Hydrogenedentota bacterium]
MMQVRRTFTGYPLAPLLVCCLIFTFPAEVRAQEELEDATIQGGLEMLLRLNTVLMGSSIRVTVFADHAALEGEVPNALSRELAAQIVASAPEIETVSNRLLIAPNPVVENAGDSWVGQVRDLTASALAIMLLSQSKGAQGTSIGIETHDGVATIHGAVRNDHQRAHIRRLVYETRGIVAMRDRMHRTPNAQIGVSPTSRPLPTDEELADRVGIRIRANSQLNVRSLRVDVVDGFCTLGGTVYRPAEQARATSLALDVSGVRGVSAAMRINNGPPPLFDAFEPEELEVHEEDPILGPGDTPDIISEPLRD